MKIVVIGRSYPSEKTGMMGIFEYEQALALSEHGHETAYLFCDTRSIKRLRKFGPFTIEKRGVSTYGYHLPIGGLPQALFAKLKSFVLKKTVKKLLEHHEKPDLIHVHFPLLTLTEATWTELKMVGCPIVVTEHWSKVQTKNLEAHRIALLKRITSEADAFLTVGAPLKQSIQQLTGTEREIQVIPNSVSPLFHYKPQRKKHEFEWIAVGRLVTSKRFDLIITAFAHIFKNNPHVTMKIVGGGQEQTNLQKQINELELTEQVTLTGALSRQDTAGHMQAANAYVSASPLETFGVPFIEALSCGKPVIGVKNNPLAAYIDETNGLLVEPEDVLALAASMEKVYEQREQYDEAVIAKQAAAHFSTEAVVTQLEKVYNSTLVK